MTGMANYGAFYVRNNLEGRYSTNTGIRGSIVINHDATYAGYGGDPAMFAGVEIDTDPTGTVIENTLIINTSNGFYITAPTSDTTINHCTIINSAYETSSASFKYAFRNNAENNYLDITNSAAVNNSFLTAYSNMSSSSDYNGAYGNAVNTMAQGTHNVTSDPSFVYPIKVEAGSSYKGTASDSGDIGATILYRYGSDGSFYGETGYTTLTAIKLWPYPNEDLIRLEFRKDLGSITEIRGFAANGDTLTNNIVEALGSTNITVTGTTSTTTSVADINEHIYGEAGETDTVDPVCAISDDNPKTLESGYTTTLGFTSSDANGIDECKWRSGSAPDETHGTSCTGTTSGTCSITGLVQGNNTIYVGCADPSNNWGSDSIVVAGPTYKAMAGGSINIR